MVMGVPVVSRLIQQELKPSAVSGLETTAQVCCVVYWEPQDLLCVHVSDVCTILKNHLFKDIFFFALSAAALLLSPVLYPDGI